MTSVAIWVGVDSHGPSSAYIATDSRFTWGSKPSTTWDLGRKTFASDRFADVGGYWGDVLFPIVTMSQFFTGLDSGVIASPDSTSETRFKALERALRLALTALPASQQRGFTIVHAARDGRSMTCEFHIRTLSWSPSSGWSRQSVPLPGSSSAVLLGGAGAGITAIHLQEWARSSEGGTSRSVYGAFVDGLRSGADPFSGGAPQLVGVYRIGEGRSIGTVVGRKRFLFGSPVTTFAVAADIEWRNELFERVSGTTRKLLPGAQRHTRPRL